ncbi:MAG: hypothetical protein KAI72_06475 [Candidatus Pacebacteria bacterium]|nr:hypothetical protein [Candidatus Paceibacterota bacterium]
MNGSNIVNRLRDEYFRLLPYICKVKEQLEAEIKYFLIPIVNNLKAHQRLVVVSRIKECESAINALRSKRQEGGAFDKDKNYSLKDLKDLAGVRILLFPRSLENNVNNIIRNKYTKWTSDPILGFEDTDAPLALKYYGYCSDSNKIYGEIQIVPMLTGLFWEVEHAAIYKPKPELKGAVKSLEMRERTQEVLNALKLFEQEFESLIKENKGT